jgi:hypothetical protein
MDGTEKMPVRTGPAVNIPDNRLNINIFAIRRLYGTLNKVENMQ